MINSHSEAWVITYTDPVKEEINILTQQGLVRLSGLSKQEEIKRFKTKGQALSYAENMYGDITLFDYMQEKELRKYENKV